MIFGLRFESELEIPEISQVNFEFHDVQIKIGKNPDHITNIIKKGALYEISCNDFLLRLNTVGTFRVKKGNTIIIDPRPNATNSEIRLFLLTSTMGALLHQRDILSLHGSSVMKNNQAITIVGHSSSGKSSLAAGLAADGYSILSDDISVLTYSDNNNFKVQPGLPYLKLWKDVLKYMHFDENYNKVRPSLNKYIKPLNLEYCANPMLLKKIICLETKNDITFSHELVTGVKKFNLIKNHTYRIQYLYDAGKIQNHFRKVTSLLEQITVFRVYRPERPLMINELVSYLNKQILYG